MIPMEELVKGFWFVIFFLFSMTLLFVWGKVYVIAGKVKKISTLLDLIDQLDAKLQPGTVKPG